MTTARRVDDVRLLVVVGLLGSAHLHAALIPVHLAGWPAAAGFFLLLTAAEVAVAGLLLARTHAAGAGGRRGGQRRPDLGVPVLVRGRPAVRARCRHPRGRSRSPGCVACALEMLTLFAVGWLLRAGPARRRRPAASAHLRGLVVAAVVAVTVIGIAGTAPSWFDQPGDSGTETVMTH